LARQTESYSPNVLISASFGHVIPKSLLDCYDPSRRLNVHPSLLPLLRGPAPIQHAIAEGYYETGVSILGIEPISRGIDTGDIWAQESVAITNQSTFLDLRMKLSVIGAALLVDVLRSALNGSCHPVSQSNSNSSQAPLVNALSTRIDFQSWDAFRIDRVHRGMGHQRPLRMSVDRMGMRHIRLHEISIHTPPASLTRELRRPGDSLFNQITQSLVVRCAKDTEISVKQLQEDGRRIVSASTWKNGVSLRRDEVLCCLGI